MTKKQILERKAAIELANQKAIARQEANDKKTTFDGVNFTLDYRGNATCQIETRKRNSMGGGDNLKFIGSY